MPSVHSWEKQGRSIVFLRPKRPLTKAKLAVHTSEGFPLHPEYLVNLIEPCGVDKGELCRRDIVEQSHECKEEKFDTKLGTGRNH